MHFRRRQPGEFPAQLLDVRALLADQHARARGVHRDAALLVRALDDDLGNAGLALLLQDVLADRHILMQQPAVFAAAGEPAAVPGAVDAEAQADRIDFVTHQAAPPALRRSCDFAHDDRDLRERLHDRARRGRGRGHESASSRVLAHVGLRDDQVVDVEAVIVFGVGDRRS